MAGSDDAAESIAGVHRSNGGSDHDAVLRVTDFERYSHPDVNHASVSWQWADDPTRMTLGPDANDRLKELIDEAHERFDLDSMDHHEVVARIWVDEDSTTDEVERVVWEGSA